MTAPIVLGCDPGKSGALAWLDSDNGLTVADMPAATGHALGAILEAVAR